MSDPTHAEIHASIKSLAAEFRTHLPYLKEGIAKNGEMAAAIRAESAESRARLDQLEKVTASLPDRVGKLELVKAEAKGVGRGVAMAFAVSAGGVGAGLVKITEWIGKAGQ